MKHLETEFKWDANTPRAFAHMLRTVRQNIAEKFLPEPIRLRIEDVYLDAADGSFAELKIAFRVRCCDGKWEATFKTRTEIKNGKAVRREETLPLPTAKNLKDALRLLNDKKHWQGLNLCGLIPLFTIRNRREIRLIPLAHGTAELAFDTCTLLVAGRQTKMKEIELELKQGRTEELETLAQRLTQRSGLSYVRVSKVKTAMGLLKLWRGE